MHKAAAGCSSGTPATTNATVVLTVWYDRHCCWVQARAQHCVLLAGVAHADDVLHVSQHCLDELVGGNAGSISKAKQGVVSEYNLHACHSRAGTQSARRSDEAVCS
jgi:hypothetical protein